MEHDATYKILVHKKFKKIVKKKLSPHLIKALDKKIKYFKDNPRHPSLNTKALNVPGSWCKQRGIDDVFEFYITKSFRCVCYVIHDNKEIILAFVGNHEDVKKHVK
jgi:mRNA-degrading endonuclease RelE of RelBE toxin-antitoxin system